MDNKDFEKYKKLLNDFKVQDKIGDLFVNVAKCLEYEMFDEDMKDVTEEIIKNEIGMEQIDTETITFVVYKEFKKWIES